MCTIPGLTPGEIAPKNGHLLLAFIRIKVYIKSNYYIKIYNMKG
jgi:hypothetical protein